MTNEYSTIPIHIKDDFIGMRKAGKLTANILNKLYEIIEPGISTEDINSFCHQIIIDNGAKPAPLNYKGFPKSVCTSVNHVVCHGIPSEDKILNDGDIINVDVTVILDEWHGDASRMYKVGKINNKAEKLIETTYECLMKSIDILKPGIHLGDIGYTIQKIAESNNFSVVRDFCGHGLGKVFHCPPSVLHFGEKGTGPILKEGMFFTIEPMINSGDWQVKILKDGWTAVTRDKSLSAQFEHTIAITNNGFEIFTI
tara:strand:- start:2916 stop:3680 length:765 start_codon:yes stop_codon:yes gene_type:complete